MSISKLHALVASAMSTPVESIDDDSGSATIATWDSMRELMLASTLEAEYGIALSTEDMLDLHTVRAIRRILESHGVGA